MANSFVTGRSTETGAMDTAGVANASTGITIQGGCLVDIAANVVSGDEIALQGEYLTATGTPPGANVKEWLEIESYTSDTAKVVRIASKRRIRMSLTTTAGTGVTYFEMTAGNRE